MKSNLMIRGVGRICDTMLKARFPEKELRKRVLAEYRAVMDRAADIGSGNNLLTSYALTGYFIAMNRNTGLSPEENCRILDDGIRKSRLVRMAMGDADSYFSEKKMASRREWSRRTHEKKYKNDWVVDIVEKGDGYEFGFNYLECGDCKLCRDEGCPELTKYMCRLDYTLVEIMGIRLHRTKVLSEGADCCDFRFSRK